MPTLIDRNGRVEDRWSWLGSEAAGGSGLPDAPGGAAGLRLILSLAQWQSHGEAWLAAGATVGICLEPEDAPDEIAGDLDRIALVVVRFPVFTDGRGYSSARLLRQRHGWKGELRAAGDILRDQLFYLARCGFDTFELTDGAEVEQALAAFGDFTESYQAAADQGPLFRRRPQQCAPPQAPSSTR